MLTRSDVFRIVEESRNDRMMAVSVQRYSQALDLIRLVADKVEKEYSGLAGQPEHMTLMDWLMPSYPLMEPDSLLVEHGGNAVPEIDWNTVTVESHENAEQRLAHSKDHQHFFNDRVCGICLKTESEIELGRVSGEQYAV